MKKVKAISALVLFVGIPVSFVSMGIGGTMIIVGFLGFIVGRMFD